MGRCRLAWSLGDFTILNQATLRQILSIGHDTSMRGEGISLRDAIERSGYHDHRPRFCATDLIPLIEADPEVITQWAMYSEDKRTSGGFALAGTSPQAVADYVIRELDFWASLK